MVQGPKLLGFDEVDDYKKNIEASPMTPAKDLLQGKGGEVKRDSRQAKFVATPRAISQPNSQATPGQKRDLLSFGQKKQQFLETPNQKDQDLQSEKAEQDEEMLVLMDRQKELEQERIALRKKIPKGLPKTSKEMESSIKEMQQKANDKSLSSKDRKSYQK